MPNLTTKQLIKRTVITSAIAGLFTLIVAYLKGCFESDIQASPQIQQQVKNNITDSASSNTTLNKDVEIKRDQNNAGRDMKNDNRKIEVKGNAFFDSSKQINYYQGLKQRHIDLELMQKIIDSIPSKKTKIAILCGGDGEGENLGKEIADYLIKLSYSTPELQPWALTGNYDITEYKFDKADSTFRIEIHPQRNDKQLH